MFKKLATFTAAAVLSIGALTGAAEARPTSCWGGYGNQANLEYFRCDVTRYYADGEYNWEGPYFYIQGIGRLFLTDHNVAYFRGFDGSEVVVEWYYDRDGDIRVYNAQTDFEFVFTPVN